MRFFLVIFGFLALTLLSACVNHDVERAAEAAQLVRLTHQDRDLKIAVNVVVDRLREVQDGDDWQALAPLEPQIYQLASDLLPGGKLAPASAPLRSTSQPQGHLARLQEPPQQRLPVLLARNDGRDLARILPASTLPQSPNSQQSFSAPPALTSGRSMFYALHLGSYRDAKRAFAGWDELKLRAPNVFANLRPRVEQVNLGSRGFFMRLKAGPLASQSDVDDLCTNLLSKGISCTQADFTGKSRH